MTLTKYNAAGEEMINEPGFAPQGVVCEVNRATAYSPTNGVVFAYDNKEFDPFGFWDGTNQRFLPKIPGYYKVTARLSIDSGGFASGNWNQLALRKNGNVVKSLIFARHITGANPPHDPGACMVYLNGSTDYADLFYNCSSQMQVNGGSQDRCWVSFELVAASVGVAPEPWHVVGASGEPALGSGWANYAGYQVPRFMKDPHGMVTVQGHVAAAATGMAVTVFTLPAGYRPGALVGFPLLYLSGGNYVTGLMRVQPTGAIELFNTIGNAFTGAVTLAFVNFNFKAEQ